MITAPRLTACGLALVLASAAASAQHPTAASQQTRPAGVSEKPATEGTTREQSDGRAPASLEEVAKRISAVLAEKAGQPAGAEAAQGPHPGKAGDRPAPARPAPPRPTAAKKPPVVVLERDPSPVPAGVSLSWDRQLDPHRARRADLGIRLVWPERVP